MDDIDQNIQKLLKENEGPEDKEVFELSREIEKIKKERDEERFLLLLSFTILLDTLLLKDCANLSLPIVIGIIEFVLILIVGKKLGIDFLSSLIEKILEAIKGK